MRFANQYGTCQIDDLPGCSQVAVSHSVFVLPKYRNMGKGYENSVLRNTRMREMLYDAAICTVDETNEREIKCLLSENWHKVHVFLSSKTGHTVGIWVKDIKHLSVQREGI
jgi:hypothetical protein